MKKIPIHTITGRFTMLVAALLIASMVTLSVVSYYSFSKMVDHKVEQLTQNVISLISRNIDYIISDVKDTSNLLLTSRAVQGMLTYAGRDDAYTFNRFEQDSVDMMNNMINNKSYLSAVYVGNRHTSLISKKSAYFNLAVSEIDYDNPPDWMNTVYARQGKGVWFHGRRMLDFEGSLLVYARQLRNLYNLQDLGIMLIALDTGALEDVFSEVARTNHMSIFIWEEGEMIYSFSDAGDIADSADPEILYETMGGMNGFLDVAGTCCYVRNMDNANAGWRISCVVPYADFETEKNFIARLIISISILLLLTAVSSAYFITQRSITGTLKQLHRFVASFREGGRREDFNFDRRDEVGVIGQEFVRVVEENEKLMINLYKSRYREKEAELIALQSQINPHFLYNTLDCIFWAAQEYGADDIARITVALSNVFRLSLNRGREVCRLRDEVELVCNYLTVQSIRYENRFCIHINIPESLMEIQVIKLILQPIVENAIQHGLEKKVVDGQIDIDVEEAGERLSFIIKDNGIGFEVDRDNPLGNGYALHNVDERIKLYYGTDCGIQIISQPMHGTVVRVDIRKDIHHIDMPDIEREESECIG